MAYPTTINFVSSDVKLGTQPINVTSTTQAHPLGTTMKAVDAVYGEGTFIYLAGVASTVAGDWVAYDTKAGTTVRTVAASVGPVAIAMSANVASQYGWYQVVGASVASTASAGTGAANAWLKVTATDGRATVSGTSAIKIDGAVCTTAQDGPGSGFTGVQINWPAVNGNT